MEEEVSSAKAAMRKLMTPIIMEPIINRFLLPNHLTNHMTETWAKELNIPRQMV